MRARLDLTQETHETRPAHATLPQPDVFEEPVIVEKVGSALMATGLALTLGGVLLTKLTKDNTFFIGPVVGAPTAAFGAFYHGVGKLISR